MPFVLRKRDTSGFRTNKHIKGRKAYQTGHLAEWFAVCWLILRGWQIVGFRIKTPQAEIDILARRRDVLAVIEVKFRKTFDEALTSVTYEQARRLLYSAENLHPRRKDWQNLSIRLDLIALAPWKWPQHIHDAWNRS